MDKIIKRTATFTLPLKEVCEGLGFKYEIDMYDDVYYESSLDDLDNYDFGKYDLLKKYLKIPFLHVSEDVGRMGYESAMINARNRDIENSLLRVDVPGEYVGMNIIFLCLTYVI